MFTHSHQWQTPIILSVKKEGKGKKKKKSMFTFKCSTAFDFASLLSLHSCGYTVVTGVALYTQACRWNDMHLISQPLYQLIKSASSWVWIIQQNWLLRKKIKTLGVHALCFSWPYSPRVTLPVGILSCLLNAAPHRGCSMPQLHFWFMCFSFDRKHRCWKSHFSHFFWGGPFSR